MKNGPKAQEGIQTVMLHEKNYPLIDKGAQRRDAPIRRLTDE